MNSRNNDLREVAQDIVKRLDMKLDAEMLELMCECDDDDDCDCDDVSFESRFAVTEDEPESMFSFWSSTFSMDRSAWGAVGYGIGITILNLVLTFTVLKSAIIPVAVTAFLMFAILLFAIFAGQKNRTTLTGLTFHVLTLFINTLILLGAGIMLVTRLLT